MRKELEELLGKWKNGSTIIIDSRKFTQEEIEELDAQIQVCVADSKRKTVPIYQ